MILSPNRAHFGGSCAGTPRDLFIDFFRIIRDTLRDVLADEWSPAIDDAWQKLLIDIADFADIPA